MKKLSLAPWQASLGVAAFIVLASNRALLESLHERVGLGSPDGALLALTVSLLMILLLHSIILVVGAGRLQKPVMAILLILSSVLGFFTDQMGIIFDEPMFRNIGETIVDRNTAEGLELLSLPLALHVLAFGLVPAGLLLLIEIRPRPLFREVGVRLVSIAAGIVLLAAVLVPNYRNVSFLARENHELGYLATPVFPLASLAGLLGEQLHRTPEFHKIDADARQRPVADKRAIGIMVVGETARADHFSLDGYARQTNPRLTANANVLYAHATSCGTSTLYSVPCMFSLRGRENYSRKAAGYESNVLDILTSAGIESIWIDNNSSCKGVCARIEATNLRNDVDTSSSLYSDAGYFDEIFLQTIKQYLTADGPDLLIVLHTLGSHGPAYNLRYPPAFEKFSPACKKAAPSECSNAEVVNAYDNTILYTDYLLSQLIEALNKHAKDFDSFLFYASDHGESLGEHGLYLHGMPYSIAPAAQTEVPMIVWLSDGFRRDRQVGAIAGQQFSRLRLSHDNISHTLLGLFDVDAGAYRPELDAFGST